MQTPPPPSDAPTDLRARSGAAPAASDAVVVGGGLIGLCCALALARRGLRVRLVAEHRRGEASPAAAGMLAPSVERMAGTAHEFAVAARDRYPAFVAQLLEETGVSVPLDRQGILRLALDPAEAERLRSTLPEDAVWLDRGELAALEPALSHAAGAARHPLDGAVDNVLLLEALSHAAASAPRLRRVTSAARRLELAPSGGAVLTADGERHAARVVVLAAGAWVTQLEGLPRAVPVEPVRGQMLSFAASPVRHVVYATDGYLVPRADGRLLVGATMEHVGFDEATTPGGLAEVRRAGETICPALAATPLLHHWAGLRPVTPDFLPILGPDPDQPALLYACGHSRNGVLMAPLTGDCIAALVVGEAPPRDLSPFSITRFR